MKKRIGAISLCFLLILLTIPSTSVVSVVENKSTSTIIENFDCFVVGMTNQTWISAGIVFNDVIGPLLDRLFYILPFVILCILSYLFIMLYSVSHLRLNTDIAFGSDFPGHYNLSSGGWIWTKGSNGVIESHGSFFGTLGRKIVYHPSMLESVYSYIGIVGFRGYKFGLGRLHSESPMIYFGYAEHVSLRLS